jgi:ribosome-associated protein
MVYPSGRIQGEARAMRGKDPESGEFLAPSRSQQRRDALDVFDLGEKLSALSDAQLARLPIPESLMPHILETRRITSHVAHKRQLQFLAKQMRREDDEALDAIRDALEEKGEAARREVAAMHRVEAWRDRLLDDGDEALAEFISEYPTADRQHLRQLVRNAIEEKKRNKPPRAFREIYHVVRDAMMGDEGNGNRETGEEGSDESE